MDPREPADIVLRPVDALTVSELDDIRAVTSRYIDTDRSDFEAPAAPAAERLA
jgi:hypothetical protein